MKCRAHNKCDPEQGVQRAHNSNVYMNVNRITKPKRIYLFDGPNVEKTKIQKNFFVRFIYHECTVTHGKKEEKEDIDD